jgi:hypothetical protein
LTVLLAARSILAVAGGVGRVTLERWVIVTFVVCIFAGVAVLGWHFTQGRGTDRMCTSAAAQCADRPYLGSP